MLAGEKAFRKTGNWLPTETLDAYRKYLVGIKVRKRRERKKECVLVGMR